MADTVIRAEHVKKEFRLGQISGGTLYRDIQSWWALKRGREDPNRKLTARTSNNGSDRFLALNDVNFEVREGDALGLIGRNGAGKSTLLKLIARITAPTDGCIYEKGRIASMLEVGTGFHPELTGRENVFLNGAILGMGRVETARKMDEIIDFSEIEQFIDTPVKRYSSGMYVKLAFAVAAHLEPEILICDEVLAVGDVRFQQKCLGKMSDVANSGRTVIYVSHNMRTIQQLCSRAICLNEGTVLYDGDVDTAIEYYSGVSMKKGLSFELDSLMRKSPCTDDVHMEALRITNTASCQYDMDDRIEFELSWRAQREVREVRMRLIVTTTADQPVATALSDSFASPLEGEKRLSVCSLPLVSLAPGEYCARIILYRSNGVGGYINMDMLSDIFRFEVLDNTEKTGGATWQTRWWGNGCLEPIDVRDGGGQA